jgi:hypothetical protein
MNLSKLSFLFPLFAVGCFASVPIVSAPPPQQQPRPVQANTAQPNTANPNPPRPEDEAAFFGLTTPPSNQTQAQAQRPLPPLANRDMIDDLTFTELFSWTISGNTPLATWSPNKSQLVFFSDYTQAEDGTKNGKKYVDLVDIKTGKLKNIGTITASAYNPIWLDDSTLVFMCTKDRCGKGKDGVYTLKTSGGSQKLAIPIKKNTYVDLFPLSNGKLVVHSEEYNGSRTIYSWLEWDPSTKKLTTRDDLPPESYETPAGATTPDICNSYTTDMAGFSQSSTVGVSNNKTGKKRILNEVSPFPYYPGDKTGIPPCFSAAVDQMLYFSYDEQAKIGKATMMSIGGYVAPVAAPVVKVAPNPNPKPTPVVQDKDALLEKLSFTELFSWNISGNTPQASWSPNKSQLVFVSDYPQKEGAEKNGKKYVELVDLKTGKLKKLGTITAGDSPTWLDETTLVFVCNRERCGKDKDGVYLLKTTGGAQKQIIPMKKYSYLSLYPTTDGTLLVRSDEYPPYSGTGPYPQAITLWQEWDPSTKKLNIRADISAQTYEAPKAQPVGYCSSYTAQLYGFSQNGQMGIGNSKTSKLKVIVEASPLTYYPGDTYGLAPCLSAASDQLIYFSYDEKAKLGKATLMKVSGYAENNVKAF